MRDGKPRVAKGGVLTETGTREGTCSAIAGELLATPHKETGNRLGRRGGMWVLAPPVA